MTQREIPKAMKENYGKLYDEIHKLNMLELSRFFPMKGAKYDCENSKVKLMLVGRCPNGWTTFDFANDTRQCFVETAENEIFDERATSPYTGCIKIKENEKVIAYTRSIDGLDCDRTDIETLKKELECANLEYCEYKVTEKPEKNIAKGFASWLYPDGQSKTAIIRYADKAGMEQRAIVELSDVMKPDDVGKVLREKLKGSKLEYYRYSISKARVLGATREVLRKLLEKNGEQLKDAEWYENIVWTNLCPVSPQDEGNANAGNAAGKLKKAQLEIAKLLLKDQIEFYKPDYVVIVTGFEGWFQYFSDIFTSVNEKRQETPQKAIVLATAMYNNSKIVVTIRPDRGVYYNDFAQQVCDAFDEIGKAKYFAKRL